MPDSLTGLILGFDFFGVQAGGDVIILKRLVALHDLPHVVHCGEHLAEIVGL